MRAHVMAVEAQLHDELAGVALDARALARIDRPRMGHLIDELRDRHAVLRADVLAEHLEHSLARHPLIDNAVPRAARGTHAVHELAYFTARLALAVFAHRCCTHERSRG